MYLKIQTDHARFRQIIKGKIKHDLRKYISNGEMIGIKGKDYISIPVPTINLPHFEFGKNDQTGVGSGDGSEGESIGQGEGEGSSGAGNSAGAHIKEVDLTFDEMAEIMGEELGLPRIQPKGDKNMQGDKN